MKTAALAFALLALGSAAHAAESTATGAGRLSAKASVDFTIRIPVALRLILVDHPRTLEVTAEDKARGYIDVQGPRIETVVNLKRGYSLQVRLAEHLAAEVTIDGLAQPVVARGSAAVPMPPPPRHRTGPKPVNYRIKLASAVAPGTYAWPVALSLDGI